MKNQLKTALLLGVMTSILLGVGALVAPGSLWIFDTHHALARKCTWALADIGTREARERLEALVKEGDETVADYARKRLANWDDELARKGPR